MSIINCHAHIFTINHVPNDFLPLKLVHILKYDFIRKPLGLFAKILIPFTDRDMIERYINFAEVTAARDQGFVLNGIRNYYPQNTRFIVLPMDMEFMGAGKVKVGLEEQLTELADLKYRLPEIVIPFIAVDPRRKNVLDLVKRFVEDHQFKGIKIYPRLGFYPTDQALYPVYEYASKNNLPIMSHCSRGGVYTHELTEAMLNHPWRGKLKRRRPKDFSHYFTEPKNYDKLMHDFPSLKVCLAHFGGDTEWDNYLDSPWDPSNPDEARKSWVSEIEDLMRIHPNLYSDISYTAFHSDRYYPYMNVLLDDPEINERILFGSDYYMVERVKKSEREMAIKLRYALGKEKFNMISSLNVQRFLNEA